MAVRAQREYYAMKIMRPEGDFYSGGHFTAAIDRFMRIILLKPPAVSPPRCSIFNDQE